MTPEDAAAATAPVVSGLPARFMLDAATYARGGELGFEGLDFYAAGRGGALGDVHSDVVAAAFVFFAPATVVAAWERSAPVAGRIEAAGHFIAAGHAWAEEHLTDEVDLARLADLLGTMVGATSPAGAPLFAAWRALPEPGPDRPQALVLHRLNLLRELRGALHGAAVLAHGLSPHQAVSMNAPYMLGIFGYDGPHPDAEQAELQATWAEAAAATERAMAPSYAALDEAERAEVRDLLDALAAPLSR